MFKDSDISPLTRTYISHVASKLGDVEFEFTSLVGSGNPYVLTTIWHPIHKAIWQLPAFKSYVREIGLYDYWRITDKWPDLCHPVGDDDFEFE